MARRTGRILSTMDDTGTKSLDFPIVSGRGLAPGIDPSGNAALLDFVDEADGAYDSFRSGAAEASQGDLNRPTIDD
jgi:hypothetical protein